MAYGREDNDDLSKKNALVPFTYMLDFVEPACTFSIHILIQVTSHTDAYTCTHGALGTHGAYR